MSQQAIEMILRVGVLVDPEALPVARELEIDPHSPYRKAAMNAMMTLRGVTYWPELLRRIVTHIEGRCPLRVL